VDKLWLWLMLACIGEVLEPEGTNPGEDFICGCVVNIRRGAKKMAIWTSNADSETPTTTIGHRIKKNFGIIRCNWIYESFYKKQSKQVHCVKKNPPFFCSS